MLCSNCDDVRIWGRDEKLVAAINDKQVSVTPIYLNLTNIPVLASLKKVFR